MKEELKKIVYPSKNICDILRLANIYKTITSGVEHNLNQVQGFDWVGQNKVDICLQNLNEQGMITISKLPEGHRISDGKSVCSNVYELSEQGKEYLTIQVLNRAF